MLTPATSYLRPSLCYSLGCELIKNLRNCVRKICHLCGVKGILLLLVRAVLRVQIITYIISISLSLYGF